MRVVGVRSLTIPGVFTAPRIEIRRLLISWITTLTNGSEINNGWLLYSFTETLRIGFCTMSRHALCYFVCQFVDSLARGADRSARQDRYRAVGTDGLRAVEILVSVDLYFDDVLNAKPIRSASSCAKPADDLVSKLFDGATGRLQVAGREERNLAVRPHRLQRFQVGVVEHGYFHDVVWTQHERRGFRPKYRPGGGWGEPSCGRSRMRALVVERAWSACSSTMF